MAPANRLGAEIESAVSITIFENNPARIADAAAEFRHARGRNLPEYPHHDFIKRPIAAGIVSPAINAVVIGGVFFRVAGNEHGRVFSRCSEHRSHSRVRSVRLSPLFAYRQPAQYGLGRRRLFQREETAADETVGGCIFSLFGRLPGGRCGTDYPRSRLYQ